VLHLFQTVPVAGTCPMVALEQCDDSNTQDGDGCSSTCMRE
jgi:cysteine-rich repeat protein